MLTQMCCFELRDVCVLGLLLMQTESGFLLSHFAPGFRFSVVTDKDGADRERGLICADTHCCRLNVFFCVHECIPVDVCVLSCRRPHVFCCCMVCPFSIDPWMQLGPITGLGVCSLLCLLFLLFLYFILQLSLSKTSHFTFYCKETSVELTISVFLVA